MAELLEERLVLTPLVADGGFENPVQPDNAFEQASGTGSGMLDGSLWAITNGAGITRNLSAFQSGGIPAPEGSQHGLIQNNGRFQQTVSGFIVGGEYELSLLTMARQNGGGGSDLEVILDRGLATEMSLIDIPEVTFNAFTEVVSPTFVASKTSYTLTIDSDRNEGALSGNRTTFFDDVAFRNIQASFANLTITDGARIQAEDFDLGPNGIGYFDTTAGNAGGQYRTGDDVDIDVTADVGGGFNITSIADGESLEYTADVTAGLYNVNFRVAATSAGGSIHVSVSSDPDAGFAELGTIAVPDTGGNWNTVTLNNINLLNAGNQDVFLRLEMIGGGFDLNWFEFSAVAAKTTRSVQSGSWDDPATWDNGIPHLLSRVIIDQSETVTLDGTDHFAGEIVVLGTLNVAESAAPRALTSRWIHVNSDGVFAVGSAANRYDEGDFVLTLTGTDPTADHVVETATGTMNVTDNDGFLMATDGGRLQFFGEEKLSFTKLGSTADVGATQITVENVIERNFTDGALDPQNNPVTSAADDGSLNWAVGDQIVIASSAYRAYEQEEVRTIVAVNNLGTQTQLTLDRALNYRHYGEIETYGQTQATGTVDPGRTWDLDMRAEVTLLSRNVRIQGTPEQDTDNQFGDRQRFDTTNSDGSLVKGIGGHTMIMATAGQTTVDGVQFDLMGQTGQLGRYPIHWHLAGDRAGDVLRNASITNSNNRGLTVHGTHNLRIEGVVQHDIHGHGFFMEDGVETGNEYIANIAYGIHTVGGNVGNTDPFKVDTHDEVQQTFNRFISSASFWITNPDNTWVGNISAGAEGSGFWFILPTRAIGASASNPIYDNVNPLRTTIREFAHNAAHSSEIGLTFDRGTDIGGTSNRYDPLDGTPVVSHFTAYQNLTAIYHRGLEQVFDELRLADNGVGTFNTYDQEIYNSLYVGHSQGNSDVTQVRRGHFLYDGPSVISDSHFAGFGEETALTFDSVGGAEKFTEHYVSGLSFENDGTYGNISNVTPVPLALNTYSAIYDGDGSLTSAVGGGPGRVVVSDAPFMVDSDGSDFQPPGWQAWVTDNRYAEFYVRRFDLNQAIPQTLVTTPEGETVDLVAVTDTANEPGGSVSVKMPLIVESGDYSINFPNGFDPANEQFNIRFEIRRRNNVPEYASTVLIFPGIGSTITVDGANRVYSEAALRSATETSYFHSLNGDLLVHLHVDPNASFQTADVYTRLVARPQRTLTTAVATGNWFDASVWDNGIPDETTRAIISQGVNVTLNGPDHVAKEIVVHGTLDVTEADEVNLLDGGFEFPVQPANAFKQAQGVGAGSLNGAQWTISGGAGITRNLSAFQSGGIPAPEGVQHGLIQGSGSFRQTVRGFVPGAEYDLSLLTMARQSGSFGNDFEVVLDAGLPSEVALIDIPEVTFNAFTEVTSPKFVATKSSYTMTISSDLNEGALSGDRTTFFDDVQFSLVTPANPVPDPVSRTFFADDISVNSGGIFQPGRIEAASDVTLNSAATLEIELNADAEFDQLKTIDANRQITLGGASLDLSLGYSPAVGTEFVIIDNLDAGSTVSGVLNHSGIPLADEQMFPVAGTFFRIDYNGGTDANDVVLRVVAPELTVNPAATSVSESAGAGATTATVSRNGNTSNALTVMLTISDTGEAMGPDTITIPAGQTTSAPFDIDAVDDAIVDGTQVVTITASAAGYSDGVAALDVTDNETPHLDIDHNGAADAATDGILIIRYLFGFRGDSLSVGAIGSGSINDTSAKVVATLDASTSLLDVDGNGVSDAATDGILIIRYLFGFRGETLVSGAIGSNATRSTGAEIALFLDGFVPPSSFSRVPSESGTALIAQKAATRERDDRQTAARFRSTFESKNVLLFQSDRNDPELPLELPVDYDPLLLDRHFESDVDWLNVISSR